MTDTTTESVIEKMSDISDERMEDKAPAKSDEGKEGKEGDSRNHRRENRGMHRVFQKLSGVEKALSGIPSLAERLERLEKGQGAMAEKLEPKPKLSDFDGDTDKWAESLEAWHDGKKAKIEKPNEDKKKPNDKNENKPADREDIASRIGVSLEQLEDFDDQIEDAREEYDDFDEVMANIGKIPQSPILTRCIVESDQGAKLSYYLCGHLKEAKAIAALTRTKDVTKALEELEERIKADSDDDSKQSSRKEPDADTRKPITPVGGGKVKNGKKDESTEQGDETMARWEQNLKKSRSLRYTG